VSENGGLSAVGWITLGRAQLNFGEFAMAVASFEKAVALDPAAAAAEDVPGDLLQSRALQLQQEQREEQRVEHRHAASVDVRPLERGRALALHSAHLFYTYQRRTIEGGGGGGDRPKWQGPPKKTRGHTT
jgi:hypothetical protein